MQTVSPGTLLVTRYEVVKTRPGGMGVVYLCRDRQEDRPAALKTFKPEYLSDRAARARFLREADTWIRLGSYPHIVRAHRVEHPTVRPEIYIVLDWVAEAEGKRDASLRAWLLPGRPLPLSQALLFGLHIARGMQHATSVVPGLVHRDLKPENVLLGRDGLARVTDFGLVKVLAEVEAAGGIPEAPASAGRRGQLTQPGATPGTPPYMAPEQWESGEILDVRTDIYAFGCLLYELVTGRRALLGDDWRDIRVRHLSGDLAPLPSGLSPILKTLLQNCLARDRAGRYPDWASVVATLATAYQAVIGGVAPSAPTPSDTTRAERVSLGYSYNDIGVSYLDISMFTAATNHFEQALTIGQVERDQPLETSALGNLGNVYRSLGEARKAIGYYEQALAVARNAGDRVSEGRTLGNIGISYAVLNDLHRAIRYYEEQLATSLGVRDLALKEMALGSLGEAYRLLGDMQRACRYYEEALATARELGDLAWQSRLLAGLGAAFISLGDIRSALRHYEEAVAIAREVGDRASEGRFLKGLGDGFAVLREFQRALRYYEDALVVAREVGDRRGEKNTLEKLGNAYRDLGDPARATHYLEQGLALAQGLEDHAGEAVALGNLGNAYRDLGDPARAIAFYEQALSITREVGEATLGASISFNLAALLALQGRGKEARRHAENAASLFAQIGHAQQAQQAQQLLAQVRGQE